MGTHLFSEVELIPVKYVGKKPTETEHLYGTNLVFLSGEVKEVPDAVAAAMCKNHPDVWADARGRKQQASDPILEIPPANVEYAKAPEERDPLPQITEIMSMEKEQLQEFATRYGRRLDLRHSVESLREEARVLVMGIL